MQTPDDSIDFGFSSGSDGEAVDVMIHVDVAGQKLQLLAGSDIKAEFPISTAAAGLGFEEGSFRTPTGLFKVGSKIGAGAPEGTVFKDREATGEISGQGGDADKVLSRILWLEGIEAANANTKQRFIYIHGTNHEEAIGSPASAGCIRMRNGDVIRLFDLVPEGTLVHIDGGPDGENVA